ncbi:MAG: DUF7219 family protein [Xenococcaceae cyanobacterium]
MEKERQDSISNYSTIQAELDCFGQKVEELCDRESECCISAKDAYAQIKYMWLQLKQSYPETAIFLLPNE